MRSRAGALCLAVVLAAGTAGAQDTGVPELSAAAEALWAADQALLERYTAAARTVVVGKVVAVRTAWTSGGAEEIATLLVEERLVGDAVGLVEVHAPLYAGRSPLIEGYRLLVFLDRDDGLVEGEGIFFVEGGAAWRRRDAEVFQRPDVDREWIPELDPQADYVGLSLAAVRHGVHDSVQVGRKKWR